MLIQKFETSGIATELSPREKVILAYIENHSGSKSGEIARKTKIPAPTVKKILSELVDKNLIEKHGAGPGTHYTLL